MEYIIHGRKPENLFRFFEEISAIPRGSGNEKGIADYLENFAKVRGLDCYRDRVNNIFIKMKGSAGRENEPAVLLQAHTDMVCEKNEGVKHDFLKDGLELYLDGRFLRARGTTLGADDGIGVVTALAFLDGASESHPPLECLFTTSEETGMDGVNGFDFSHVSARKMLNLDSEDIGTAIVGCAGGVRVRLTLKGTPEAAEGKTLRLCVKGLAGGHSGSNIADGRANANKLMGRILLALGDDLRLVSLTGGGKSNAIPRECEALIVTPDAEKTAKLAKSVATGIAGELGEWDNGFEFICEEVSGQSKAFGAQLTAKALAMIGIPANGVLEMSKRIDGFVEYSRNLGVIRTKADGISFTFFARSAIEGQLDATCCELASLAKLCGAEMKINERYHGWDYSPESEVRDAYAAAYKRVTGKDINIAAIHAGLECGVIKERIPDMDIIAIGPDAIDIHSPDEKLDLDTAETFFAVIAEMLAK